MPAPSPPDLKSSIEYFAMSVGIGRILYGPPSLHVLLDQVTRISSASPPPMTIKISQLCLVNNFFYFLFWKIANMGPASCQNLKK